MNKNTEQAEYIIWKENNTQNECREIHAIGFVIKETKSSITISLTKNYGKYIDIQKIDKNNIVSRNAFINS